MSYIISRNGRCNITIYQQYFNRSSENVAWCLRRLNELTLLAHSLCYKRRDLPSLHHPTIIGKILQFGLRYLCGNFGEHSMYAVNHSGFAFLVPYLQHFCDLRFISLVLCRCLFAFSWHVKRLAVRARANNTSTTESQLSIVEMLDQVHFSGRRLCWKWQNMM